MDPSIFQQIAAYIQDNPDGGQTLSAYLREQAIAHLSYSSISAVEFCERRYYLSYVEKVELDPVPLYFEKGRAFHHAAARYYLDQAQGIRTPIEELIATLGDRFHGFERLHLINALRVMTQVAWKSAEVIAVERPFVLQLDPDLPPCVGVIDLVLRQGARLVIIDHKTGGKFPTPDPLQMAIYARYLQTAYGVEEVRGIYECYRWVNDLSRIRTPAIRRLEVPAAALGWERHAGRVAAAAARMRQIEQQKNPAWNGECFLCPYRSFC